MLQVSKVTNELLRERVRGECKRRTSHMCTKRKEKKRKRGKEVCLRA